MAGEVSLLFWWVIGCGAAGNQPRKQTSSPAHTPFNWIYSTL